MIYVNFLKLDQLICHLSVISLFFWCEIVDRNVCSRIFSVITHYFMASKCHFVHMEVDDNVIQDYFCLVFLVDILLISLKY
jgi:hypothetical protein